MTSNKTTRKWEERTVTNNKEMKEECNHAIASHEGHGLEYAKSSKYISAATKESLADECCGEIILFNFCPFCGKEVRKIIQKITK